MNCNILFFAWIANFQLVFLLRVHEFSKTHLNIWFFTFVFLLHHHHKICTKRFIFSMMWSAFIFKREFVRDENRWARAHTHTHGHTNKWNERERERECVHKEEDVSYFLDECVSMFASRFPLYYMSLIYFITFKIKIPNNMWRYFIFMHSSLASIRWHAPEFASRFVKSDVIADWAFMRSSIARPMHRLMVLLSLLMSLSLLLFQTFWSLYVVCFSPLVLLPSLFLSVFVCLCLSTPSILSLKRIFAYSLIFRCYIYYRASFFFFFYTGLTSRFPPLPSTHLEMRFVAFPVDSFPWPVTLLHACLPVCDCWHWLLPLLILLFVFLS